MVCDDAIVFNHGQKKKNGQDILISKKYSIVASFPFSDVFTPTALPLRSTYGCIYTQYVQSVGKQTNKQQQQQKKKTKHSNLSQHKLL